MRNALVFVFALSASVASIGNAQELLGGPVQVAATSETTSSGAAQTVAPAPTPAAPPIVSVAVIKPDAPTTGVVTSWPAAATATRNGVGLCIDSMDGSVPTANIPGQPARLSECAARESQRITLKDGLLLVGAQPFAVLEPMGLDRFPSCQGWWTQSKMRTYVLNACRATRMDETNAFALRLDADNNATLDMTRARGVDTATVGTPIMMNRFGFASPRRPVWEQIAATGQIRLIGTNLCIAPAVDDATAGAPLYLDECTAPIAKWDGSRAAPDGRARFEAVLP